MPPAARKPSPKKVVPPPAEEESETPIHDQIRRDLENANPADVTLFEEDDDPLSNVGELVDEPDADSTKENV